MNIIQAQEKTPQEYYMLHQSDKGMFQSRIDNSTGKTYLTGYVSRLELPAVIIANGTRTEIAIDGVDGGKVSISVMDMDNRTQDLMIWAVPTDSSGNGRLCGPVYGIENQSFQIETNVTDYGRVRIFAVWHNRT
jgi:hypothetical protein